MRIVVVARGLPEANDPTLGIFELDQAAALAAAGHDVVVAALDLRSARRRRRLGMYGTTVRGLRVVVVAVPVGAVGPAAMTAGLRFAWRLALPRLRKTLGGPIDIVHAHFARFGAAARPGPGTRYRLVVTEHSSRLGGVLSEAESTVARQAYQAASRVIAVSPWLVDKMAEAYGVTATYVPNVVDVDAYAREHVPRPPGSPARLVSIGFLVPRKRMGLLAQGYALSRPELDATLTIIGDGPDREIVEATQAPGLTVRGTQPRTEIAATLAAADGFVLLSEFETFGVVYAEAMAAGVPVLASRCGGPEGFVDDQVGRFTEATTPDAVAVALESFVGGLSGYDRDAIRARARAEFAPDVVAAMLTAVYEEVR